MASPRILPSSLLQKLATFKDTASIPPISSSSSSPLDSFASDSIFSTFLSPDFDSARFSSQALSSGSAAARVESLHKAIRLLHQHLRSEVLSRHPALLSSLRSPPSAPHYRPSTLPSRIFVDE